MLKRLAGLLPLVVATVATAGEPAIIVDKVAFPEAPFVREGKLFFVEYAGHKIDVWDGKALSTLWEEPGCGPSAVAPLGGDLAVTCYDSGTIARVSIDGKTVAHYAQADDGTKFQGPNDFAADGKGGLFFTASGPWEPGPIVGRVFHLSGDGTVKALADDLHYANGIVLGADGKRLFVNESEAGRVISFVVGEDGSLSDRRLFVRVGLVDEASGPGAYPDGIKLGPDGNFYIGEYSKGRIVVVKPDGSFVRGIDVPSAAAPNLAFAEDGKSIYVTAVDDKDAAPYWGKVYRVPLE